LAGKRDVHAIRPNERLTFEIAAESVKARQFVLRGRRRPPHGPVSLRTAQDRPDTGEQLSRLERFRYVVVRANFETNDLVDDLAFAREHDEGRFRRGAQRASERDAVVSVRKGHVEDNEVERSGRGRLPHGHAAQGEFRGKAFMFEEFGDETAHAPVVVHDQDSLASRHCPPFAVVPIPEGTVVLVTLYSIPFVRGASALGLYKKLQRRTRQQEWRLHGASTLSPG